LEKVNLDIGFIPLTDCAPLVVAKEKGFFQAHGLEQVNLCREPSWNAIGDGMISDRLDAAQMIAGLPLAMTLGMGGNAPLPMLTALVLSRNGNAITLSKSLYQQGVRTLEDFQNFLAQSSDKMHTLGMVHPASMHNLMLRYWLASGGIDPDRDVKLAAIPPAQMVANLEAGNIDGFCVGDPWNSRAVKEGIGVVIATDLDIWASHPEKVLGVREDWLTRYPETHNALVKAMLQACAYCDDRRNREEILELLCRPEYVGTAPDYIRPGFIDAYDRGTDEPPTMLLRFNQFSVAQSNCPSPAEGLWILTQLARWGITAFPKNWVEILQRTHRVDLYTRACEQLELPGTQPNRDRFQLFDGKVFDPNAPLEYLRSFELCHDIQIEEISFDRATTVAA
jgi:nitrate/nitrite transport system ATP-binding protein